MSEQNYLLLYEGRPVQKVSDKCVFNTFNRLLGKGEGEIGGEIVYRSKILENNYYLRRLKKKSKNVAYKKAESLKNMNSNLDLLEQHS